MIPGGLTRGRGVMAAVSLACACGGEHESGARAAAGVGDSTAAGVVHEVRMVETTDGRYLYDPAELTIRQGERVRWINVSGGPHNVEFYEDRIPEGAKEILNAAMADRMGDADLVGPLLFDDGESYEIAFAGAPPGGYAYVCTPHALVGMTGTLVVTR